MSKSWYPVIDYELCTECGACVDKCSHGVYDKSKYPSPKVINTDGCIQGCQGCGNLCPSGAIKYVGDAGDKNDCGCCCSEDGSGNCC